MFPSLIVLKLDHIMTVNEIIQTIRNLPSHERIEIMHALADTFLVSDTKTEHSILELEGLGAEIWQDVDAQDYINQLRDEWDHGA